MDQSNSSLIYYFVTLQRATQCYAVLRSATQCVSFVCGGSLSDGLWWAYDLPLIGSE